MPNYTNHETSKSSATIVLLQCVSITEMNLLRVVGLVVAELRLLLQDLVHLGGVRGGIVAAVRGGGGHGQNGGEHKLKTKLNVKLGQGLCHKK